MTTNSTFLSTVTIVGLRTVSHIFAVIITSFLLTVPLEATNANYRLCFTQVVGLPITNPNQPPTIDGVVPGDPGWTQAFRYVWANGAGPAPNVVIPPNAALQGIRDNTYLYLSIEVNYDSALNQNNLVVLAFSPSDGATPTSDWRLDLYPLKPDTTVMPNTPYTVQYRTNSSAWTPGSLPSSLNGSIAVTSSGSGSNFSWVVEMRIPLASFNIPATGKFGFYFNVTRVGSLGFATQYFWPSFTGNGITVNPVNTPATSSWGDATQDPALATTCKGVSLNWDDITSNHSFYQIDATPGNSNTFSASPHNNSVDMNSNPIAASQITAKFSIANFGLVGNCGTSVLDPNCWSKVPVTNNPAGPTNLLAGCGTGVNPPCTALSTTPAWNITDSNLIANYKSNPDQCILVELDSLAPDCVANPTNCVSILNKSVKRNMWVLTASQVSKKAQISAKGYEPHPAHKTEQEFVLHVASHREVLGPNQQAMSRTAAGQGPVTTHGGKESKVVISRLTWAVGGCRLTGQYITINGTTYELCDDVGAFGAIVEHFGRVGVGKWLVSLEGPGLTRDQRVKDTYRLRVPQDGMVTVATNFRPEEAGRLAVFLDAGAAVPHGTFSNAFNTGFSLNAGLEYIITDNFSAEGIFGYHRFPAKTVVGAVLSDLNLYQFSANGKAYLTNSRPFRPFVNAGIGGYHFTPGGNTYFGGNVGAGVLRQFNSHWGVQASYNFHTVNTPVTATKFSTVQIGIRFVF